MFGISGVELFLILLFGFLIFGPDKLPAIAKTIGKGIAKFRAAQQDMNDVIKSDVYDPSNPDAPFKDPTKAFDKLADTAEKHIKGAASDAKEAVSSMDLGKKGAKAQGAAAQKTEGAEAAAPEQTAPAHQESFTERKARYERERAARKAAEEQKAPAQAPADEAGGRADAAEGGER